MLEASPPTEAAINRYYKAGHLDMPFGNLQSQIRVKPPDGGKGDEGPQILSDVNAHSLDWSGDGQKIIYQPGSNQGLRLLDLKGRDGCSLPPTLQPTTAALADIRDHPASRYEGEARFSPNDEWIAYASDDGWKSSGIFVRSASGEGSPVSVDGAVDGDFGGRWPHWKPDGSGLYFLRMKESREQLMEVAIRLGAAVEPRKAHLLFDAPEVTDFVPVNAEMQEVCSGLIRVQGVWPNGTK